MQQLRSVRELASAIRDRRRCGWSQATLAGRVGVGRDWIIQLEKGKPTVEFGLVLRTLRTLGVAIRLEPAAEAPTSEIDLGQILGRPDLPEQR